MHHRWYRGHFNNAPTSRAGLSEVRQIMLSMPGDHAQNYGKFHLCEGDKTSVFGGQFPPTDGWEIKPPTRSRNLAQHETGNWH